jgi:hypothetical protein
VESKRNACTPAPKAPALQSKGAAQDAPRGVQPAWKRTAGSRLPPAAGNKKTARQRKSHPARRPLDNRGFAAIFFFVDKKSEYTIK